VHFHFTPTYSSGLNQAECWFSILARQALEGASFTSARQLRQAIDDFVAVYHPKAAPFEWKKAVVFSSGPKRNQPTAPAQSTTISDTINTNLDMTCPSPIIRLPPIFDGSNGSMR
jgi:hypothetical protein